MRKAAQTTILFLCLVCFPLLPAQADMDIQTVDDSSIYHYRVSTFQGELPPVLAEVLAQKGFAYDACHAGAMLEEALDDPSAENVASLRQQYAAAKGQPFQVSQHAIALVSLDRGGQRTLVGLLRGRGTGVWAMEELGPQMLLSGRDFTIEIRGAGVVSRLPASSRLCTVYQRPEGGTEAYGFLAREDCPWYVCSYETVDSSGQGTAVLNAGFPSWLHLMALPASDGASGETFTSDAPLWTAYMNSIADFPTTRAQLERHGEESQRRLDGTDLAKTAQVNLRTEPTGGSPSQGELRYGTLVHVLGQKKGKTDPWYHVRVGDLEGWVAGNYMGMPYSRNYWDYLSLPQPLARALGPLSLREKPASGAKTVAELAENTLVHVALVSGDGWLYVVAPTADLSWQIDVDGMGGYVRAEEVAQGMTPASVAP